MIMFYRCINCGVLVGKSMLNDIIREKGGCLKCGKRGWVEHDPQSSTPKVIK